MLHYAFIFIISVVASALLTWAVRNVAKHFGLAMARPSPRHIHINPTPRLGGVAVFLTFAAVFSLYLPLFRHQWIAQPANAHVAIVVVISVVFFLTGLVDDLRGLSAWAKLALQVSGAVCLYVSGIHFGSAGAAGHWGGQLYHMLLTVFWVVLICNAINLIDGLDGLAAGAALFSMVTVFALALGNQPGIAAATAILGGSLFGFLVFNFNPASIFLGDSGSLFVGFMLSGLVLTESQKQNSALDAIFVPLVSFALPLTDVGVSILRRFLSGHSLFGADREHIHHKLLELGLTQRQVVWVLYGISALCSVLSLFLLRRSDIVLIPVLGVLLLVLFFGLRKLEYHEFTEFRRLGRRVAQQRRVFARNIAVRKAAARLETTCDPRALLRILEGCLYQDFDGFAITTSDELSMATYLFPPPWREGSVRLSWNESGEDVVIRLELSVGASQIGTLALYQSAGHELLIDTDLIKGHLRNSVAMAIRNSAGTPRLATIPFPSPERAPAAVPAGYLDRKAEGLAGE